MVKPRILVVDDEESIRKTLRMTLEYEGYEVTEASSGSEALEKIEHEPSELVFLDIKMPGMDGLEVLAEVRERTTAPQAGDDLAFSPPIAVPPPFFGERGVILGCRQACLLIAAWNTG